MIVKLRSSLLLIVLISPLFTGCNALTLTYNYVDWIFLWRIDHYFNISSQQQQSLKPRLVALHQWHREKELPQYAHFLREIQRAWQDGFTAKELDRIFYSYQVRYNQIARRIALEGSHFLSTLNAQQVQYLQEIMQENHEELLEKMGRSSKERLERRKEKYFHWLEYFLGGLNFDQQRIISHLIENLPDTTSAWLNHRAYRQQQFVYLLRTERDPDNIAKQVEDWLASPPRDTFQEFSEGNKKMREAFKLFLLQVDQIITPEQREHGQSTLRLLIHNIESLSTT